MAGQHGLVDFAPHIDPADDALLKSCFMDILRSISDIS